MRFCCAAVLLFACVPPSYTQPPAAPHFGSIAGLVVDDDNKPISRAIVSLSTTGANPQDAVAWTDEAGRFAFGYLPPASYRLYARTAAGLSAAFGTTTRRATTAVIHVRAGENRTDLVCRLPRTASISGTVLDADGDPAPAGGNSVIAMQSNYGRGARHLTHMASAAVDAQGRYRFSNLRPGTYAICLQFAMMPGLGAPSEASAKQPSQEFARPSQCYPGTDDPKSVAMIAVQSGKDVSGIDFRTILKKTVAVTGHIELPDDFGAATNSINLTVISADLDLNGFRTGVGVSPETREFHVGSLPPGRYALIATAQSHGRQYRGVQQITLEADSPQDVTIPLEHGVDVAGRVLVVGPDAAQHLMQHVTFAPGDNLEFQGPHPSARVQPDGAFKIENVLPGIWDINVGPIPKGGYIKSMLLGKQDVLTEEMRITSSTSAPLNIVVATKGAAVTGDVVDSAKHASVGIVVLAPEGKWHGVFSFYGFTQTDDQGHFEITGVTPGSYKLYALDQFDMNAQGPDGLDPFAERGLRVDLKEAETLTRNLTVITTSAGAP